MRKKLGRKAEDCKRKICESESGVHLLMMPPKEC